MADKTERPPSVFVVRAEHGQYVDHFLRGRYVGVRFAQIDLTGVDPQNKEAIQQLYAATQPGASKLRIAQNTGQMVRFLTEIVPGAYVVTPEQDANVLHVGRVTGDHYFEPNPADGCPAVHRRPVEWFARPLMRNTLSVPAQNTLGSLLAVFRVKQVEEILGPYGVRLPEQTRQAAITEEALSRLIINQILELSADEFELLVTELLNAIGFEAEKVGKVGDDGIDVKGKLRVYEFASVALEVQVKRYAKQSINKQTIKSFRSSIPTNSQAAFVPPRSSARRPGKKPKNPASNGLA